MEAIRLKSSPSITLWMAEMAGVGVKICNGTPGVKVGLGVLVGVGVDWPW